MAKSKFWLQAHWLVGVTVGVVLGLMGLTGAMMSFQDPILEALNAEARKVEVKGERLSMPTLLAHAQAEAQRTGTRLRSVALPKEADVAARVIFISDGGDTVRLLDPYTGEWRTGGVRGESSSSWSRTRTAA